MKFPAFLPLCIALLSVGAVPCARAQQAPPAAPPAVPGEPNAEQIVALVQASRAVKDRDLRGVLTKDDLEVPFVVSLKADYIRFGFDNPKQIIHLDLKQKGSELREVVAGSNKPVPEKRYAEGIRGTDLTYDDISLRFLYWANKVKQPNLETVKTRKCWVVDLHAERKVGEYATVRIFVDRESGGLMRMQAYDWQGQMIKVLAVTSGMKVDGATVLKSMDVIRYAPGTKKAVGETTFELQKP